MRRFMLLVASALAVAGAGPAAGQPRGPMCNLSAYYLNGARLDVRAGPSANARRLQTRPYQGSPVAEITGQSITAPWKLTRPPPTTASGTGRLA